MKSDYGKKARQIVNICLKPCINKDTEACKTCLRFSNFKERDEDLTDESSS